MIKYKQVGDVPLPSCNLTTPASLSCNLNQTYKFACSTAALNDLVNVVNT